MNKPEPEFLIVSQWDDGDVVYRIADTPNATRGTRDREAATRFNSREAAEIVVRGLLGGVPECVGHAVFVERA